MQAFLLLGGGGGRGCLQLSLNRDFVCLFCFVLFLYLVVLKFLIAFGSVTKFHSGDNFR